MRRTFAIGAAALIAATGLLTACGGGAGGGTETTQPKTANLVYVNWAEGVDYTHLAKVVLEDKLGYEVTITAADVAPAYASVAQGDKDAFMETWLPVLHKDYWDRFKDKLVDLGPVYEGTQSGLVVPAYVTIDTISQLNDYRDKFDGQIIGIDAGAGIMKTAQEVINDYGLNFELISSSGPAMTAALKKAIDGNDWIVVTGWKPHWMFARWDLKFLEQDKEKIWKTGHIDIVARKNLRTDKPELAKFLTNYHFTDPQLSDLMLSMREAKDLDAAAREWMNQHEDLVQSWLPRQSASQ